MKIEELNNKYGQFSDSWIKDIQESGKSIFLTIVCANKEKQFRYEIIQLEFITIESFILKKGINLNDLIIKDALLYRHQNQIIFDTDPIDQFDYLEENPNSVLKIKSKSIDYKFVKLYTNSDL